MTIDRRSDVHFFTMGDSGYFLGAVALVNSLRIVGHDEPITFLDLGLTPAQREILSKECEVIDIERDPADHPFTFQPYPAVLHPTGICVIVDSDVIVTQRLDALIEAAAAGAIAAFPDQIVRRVPEWESIFELRAPLRCGIPYVNSGLVAFDAQRHFDFLARWWYCCRGLHVTVPISGQRPTGFADQDALNALLMSEHASDGVALRSPTMRLGAPALAATRVDDVTRLECTSAGGPVAALHSVTQPKPWMPEARSTLRRNAYLRCLRRCLAGDDLAIAIPDGELPPWLRRGRMLTVTSWFLHQLQRIERVAYHARVWSQSTAKRDPSRQTVDR